MISSTDFQKITTLIFDIDGTLTDSRALFLPDGRIIKSFDHHDMHWIKLALRAGLKVGVLSGRDDPANENLVRELNLSFALLGVKDKIAGFEEILQKNQLTAAECCYMGDDVVDMPVIRRAGIGVAVADAVEELNEAADIRTSAPGGKGAACEIIRRILKEKGLFDHIMERYRR